MWIWEIECTVFWSFHDSKDDADLDLFSVAAKNYEEAISKLHKVALAKSRGYKNEDGKMEYPLLITDITKFERKNWIDG